MNIISMIAAAAAVVGLSSVVLETAAATAYADLIANGGEAELVKLAANEAIGADVALIAAAAVSDDVDGAEVSAAGARVFAAADAAGAMADWTVFVQRHTPGATAASIEAVTRSVIAGEEPGITELRERLAAL